MASAGLAVVILAAGKGTRMRSALPKVLHPLAGVPMVARVCAMAGELSDNVVVVTAPDGQSVRDCLATHHVRFAIQQQQRGTGDALAAALAEIGADIQQVLVVCADTPLLSAATLAPLQQATPVDGLGVLTARVDDPGGLGRILRSSSGAVTGIVEERDASPEQRGINEINTGIYLLPRAPLAQWLERLDSDNAQGEYYLTDVIGFAVAEQRAVCSVECADPLEVSGVNDRLQLARLERIWQQRQAEALLRDGVQVVDPARIDVRGELVAGQDSIIDVNCVFAGQVRLGARVRVGAHCVIEDAEIGDDAVIEPFTHIHGARVGSAARVGPFARLREGTELASEVRVGNFVETKKAYLGVGSKANHLAYLGDAEMGAGCNVGAGTITCNYDGVGKHPTRMADGVFVGSNSTLVAPISLAEGAYVAAGSTLTGDVPAGGLGVGRARQRNIDKWKSPKQRQDDN